MAAFPLRKPQKIAVEGCLSAWRAVLPSGTILNEAEYAVAQQNCLGVERDVIAALRPKNEEEVIAIVQVANRFKVPLYSYSIGNNWGYGTRLPVVDGCALVDLSCMNRIVAMDVELGLVTVEPGVTQQQLYLYLKEHGYAFFVPTTGAGLRGSLVGNALERGFGLTPDEDHFRAVTSMRAVMADGSVYQSPFTEMGADHAGVWKWGVGPYVDGLFAQGNLGIVTQLQIALAQHAEHVEIFSMALRKNTSLETVLEDSKALLADLRGPLKGIKFVNAFQMRIISGEPLDTIPENASQEWLGVGVYHCRKALTRALRREVKRSLSPSVQLVFMNVSRLRALMRVVAHIPGKLGAALRLKCENAGYVLDVTSGIPRNDALQLVYSFVKPTTMPPTDPVADGVGMIWYAPVLPMKPALISAMMTMIQATLQKHGRPPMLSFTTVSEKCAIGVIPILYQRPEDVALAHACYAGLVQGGIALGCPPYRVNVAAMEKLTGDKGSIYWDSVAKIKAALDPNHILSPGRYCRIES